MFKDSVGYYDSNNVFVGSDTFPRNNIYMCVYNEGNFITSKIIKTTESTISLNSMRIQNLELFLSFEYNGDIFFDSNAVPMLDGSGICVTNYTFDLVNLNCRGRIKISGSNIQDNTLLSSNSDYLFIIGNFNSNPVTFYNPNDEADGSLSNVLYDNQNIFIVQYPIDYFIQNNLSLNYKF